MLKNIVRALVGAGSNAAPMTYQEAAIEALRDPSATDTLHAALVALQGGDANAPRARAVRRQLEQVGLAQRRHAVAAEWARAHQQITVDLKAAEAAADAAGEAVTTAREQSEDAEKAADRAASRANEMRQSINAKRVQASIGAQGAIDKATGDLERAESVGDDVASQAASNALMRAKGDLAAIASESADDLRLAALVALSATAAESAAKAAQSLAEATQRHGAAEFEWHSVLFDRTTLQMVESWLSMVQAAAEAGLSKELGHREFSFWIGNRDRFPLCSRLEARSGPVPAHVITALKQSVEPLQAAVFEVDPQALPNYVEPEVTA